MRHVFRRKSTQALWWVWRFGKRSWGQWGPGPPRGLSADLDHADQVGPKLRAVAVGFVGRRNADPTMAPDAFWLSAWRQFWWVWRVCLRCVFLKSGNIYKKSHNFIPKQIDPTSPPKTTYFQRLHIPEKNEKLTHNSEIDSPQ